MTKQEFINLSIDKGLKFISTLDNVEGMPSSNKIWTCNGVSVLFGKYFLNTVEDNDAYPSSSCKLLLRPLSDIAKEIEHKGKKFVPIVEIGKIAFPHADHYKYRIISGEYGCGVYFENYRQFKLHAKKIEFTLQYFYNNSIQAYCVELNNMKSEYAAINNVTSIILKLIEWHFNLMDESEEFIDVNTLETNPYK